MNLKDEEDYLKENAGELRSRLMSYQFFAQVLLKGYAALLNYGVNFMDLPEWKDDEALNEARKLKPEKGSEKIVSWLTRLENAIAAAVRRKQFRVNNQPPRKDN
jgi:hypothetical protein